MDGNWENFQEVDGSRSYPLRAPIRPRTRWTQHPGRLSQHHSPIVANRSWFQQPTYTQYAYMPTSGVLPVPDASRQGRGTSVSWAVPPPPQTPPGIDTHTSRNPPILNPNVLSANATYSPAAYASFSQAAPDSHLDNSQSDPSSVSPFWAHQASLRHPRSHDEQHQSTSTHIRRHTGGYFGQSSDPSGARLPVLQHKVYKIHCASCNLFLTDRGMKAVLLLRPNISLYSSDALPVNCSTPPRSSAPSSSDPHVPRTCGCLTQTLCCHGCGSAIGYAIVAPCSKCSSPATRHQNTANGHRFVFHHSQVVANERLYAKGEPGVAPYHVYPFNVPYSRIRVSERHETTNSSGDADTYSENGEGDRDEDGEYKQSSPILSPGRPEVRLGESSASMGQPASVQRRRRLKPGDVVWWHNLARSGDLPGIDQFGTEEDVNLRMLRLRKSMKCLR